ncbi:hypothetical protein, partial [Pseudonocardia oceani]|uniref:hypothetical protein n=1 Tax=Pseudonocardia oceani TaxID=2792013 RepID=UPI001C4A36E8
LTVPTPRAEMPSSGGDDPVQAIQHTTATFHVTEVTETNIISIDDRDVIFNDSFNSDDDVTIIDDSFNDSSSVVNDVTAIQDNDTIINDNDTIDIEDNDTIVEGGAPVPANPPVGIGIEDIVGPAGEPEATTQVEPEQVEPEQVVEEPVVAEVEPEPEPEPEVEADVEPEVEADVDAAIV